MIYEGVHGTPDCWKVQQNEWVGYKNPRDIVDMAGV